MFWRLWAEPPTLLATESHPGTMFMPGWALPHHQTGSLTQGPRVFPAWPSAARLGPSAKLRVRLLRFRS